MTGGVASVRAAGGVLWRRAPAGVELALVHRPKYDDWSLPKGKLEPGEHPLRAACREVTEETGCTPRAGRRLASAAYHVLMDGQLLPKTVDYWAMEALEGAFAPHAEIDALRWLRPATTMRELSRDNDRAVLESFLALPYDTTTVLLIRHGSAGDRLDWVADDELRPLDDLGREQARRVCELLPAYRPTRVVSADLVRCVETVRPLAGALGLPIELDPALTEQAHGQRPRRAMRHLRALAALGRHVAVCSQGGVIPDSVAALAAEDGVPMGRVRARKGSVWVLSFVGDRLVAADYLATLAADSPSA